MKVVTQRRKSSGRSTYIMRKAHYPWRGRKEFAVFLRSGTNVKLICWMNKLQQIG